MPHNSAASFWLLFGENIVEKWKTEQLPKIEYGKGPLALLLAGLCFYALF